MGSNPELPDDLLIDIFLQSLLYSSLFNPALTLGHVSAWSMALRHKKSIILVCKRWAACGTPFLYHKIIIRRYGQLGDLLRTLDHVDGLASHIVDLTISESCYVHDMNADLFGEDLQRVYQLCPHLTRLQISPHLQITIPDSLLSSLSNITKLGLGTVFKREERTRILMAVSEKLASLSLNLVDEVATTELIFPQLRELSITFKDWNQTSNLVVPTTWALPSLESLSIHGHRNPLQFYPSVQQFIQKHGRTLLYLSLTYSSHYYSSLVVGPSAFLSSCPNLVHLATDFIPTIERRQSLTRDSFPSIKTFDLFHSDDEEHRHDAWRGFTSRLDGLSECLECFPSLEAVTLCHLAVENLFRLPLPYRAGPVTSIFREAWNWVRPAINLSISYSFRQIDGVPSRDYGDNRIVVYSISPPAPGSQCDHDWGEDLLEGFLESPPSSTENSELPVETETSYDSDISQGELEEIQRGQIE